MAFIPIRMNAARVCDGLSKIGYTPSSAICDIIDNAATAKAMHVYVKIVPERNVSENRRNNVKEYLIIDDGKGMNREELERALMLGSPSDNYELHSLSKFGLGLKSAAFSQGEILEVISSKGDVPFLKYRVSLPEIRRRDEYGAEEVQVDEEDQKLINEYLSGGRGTIVRIATVRKEDHPSIKSTLQELQTKVGVIYYYLMYSGDFHVIVNDRECTPFDVLFTEEANTNSNLNEYEWDGRTTCWIQKPRKITIDGERNITAIIEATQLPHPPTFDLDGPGLQKEIRDKYRIGAGNYGYYVYRNHRLLSWCESFNMIPQDQDYYSFRGRILIDDSADEVFNIDVKKSHIHLSEEANQVIEELTQEYRRKSRLAWNRAKSEINRIKGENGTVQANDIAQQFEMPEELPGDVETEQDYKEAQQRGKELEKEQEKKIREIVEEHKTDPGIADLSEEEQIEKVVKGPESGPADKIFLVESVLDNALWEPYFDADKGPCVRLNRLHRFTKTIYEKNPKNVPLQVLMDLLFLQLAGAEIYVQRNYTKYDREQIAAILEEYRRVCSEYLAALCRDQGELLPAEEE